MSKFINIKKLTANSLIGVLLAGGLIVESSKNQAVAASCSNNGHGNNAPMTISLPSGDLTIGHYDPSNPSDSQRNKLIDDLDDGHFGTTGSNKVPNNRQFYIDFTGSSYNLTNSEAVDIVNTLPDWEFKYNGSTEVKDCGGDFDNDGISDSVEIGSDVFNPLDSDGNGIPDYAQPNASSNNNNSNSNSNNSNNGNSNNSNSSSNSNNSNTITLTGTLRDFSDTHPDFERQPGVGGFGYGLDTGITTDDISSDRNPVYAGGSYSTTTQGNFDQWYRDVNGVNQSMEYSIDLVKQQSNGLYRFSSNSFFPLDGLLMGDQGRSHNYHFTYELHGQFTYKGGEVLEFSGDDDVWVYINGKKVIDIGGVHSSLTRTVDIDSIASSAGMTIGGTYDFDFFFAERHTTQSNFTLTTSIELLSDADANGIADVEEDAPTFPSGFTFPTGGSPDDIDGDGVPNSSDTDNDGNGIDDDVEDEPLIPSGFTFPTGGSPDDIDGDGVPNSNDPDNDGNGIDDDVEDNPTLPSGFTFPTGGSPDDIDGDGVPNSSDTDNDGNGIDDDVEDNPTLPYNFVFPTGGSPDDIDGDGVPNSSDTDNDGNGVDDDTEDNPTLPSGFTFPTGGSPDDIDGDGVPNSNDPDNDDNGIDDDVESNPACLLPTNYAPYGTTDDLDGDGALNIDDDNNDNDDLTDIEEINFYAPNPVDPCQLDFRD